MKFFKRSISGNPFDFPGVLAWWLLLLILTAPWLSACGNRDAKPIIIKFCAGVQTGESVMDVFQRAEKVEFDKYWLEKYREGPGKGDVLGVIRSHEIESNPGKIEKLKDPATWEYGQFKAMIQEFGYSRHVCSVDFVKGKVLGKETYSVD